MDHFPVLALSIMKIMLTDFFVVPSKDLGFESLSRTHFRINVISVMDCFVDGTSAIDCRIQGVFVSWLRVGMQKEVNIVCRALLLVASLSENV